MCGNRAMTRPLQTCPFGGESCMPVRSADPRLPSRMPRRNVRFADRKRNTESLTCIFCLLCLIHTLETPIWHSSTHPPHTFNSLQPPGLFQSSISPGTFSTRGRNMGNKSSIFVTENDRIVTGCRTKKSRISDGENRWTRGVPRGPETSASPLSI